MFGDLVRKLGVAIGVRPPSPLPPWPAEPGELAPPASRRRADIEAWVLANLDLEGGWRFLGISLMSVRLVKWSRPGPFFEVFERIEQFVTGPDAEKRPTRSVTLEFEMDARKGMLRFARATTFRFNNLKEPHPPYLTRDAWGPVAEDTNPFSFTLNHLCQVGRGAPEEGPASLLSRDVHAWIDRTLTAGADRYAYFDDFAVTYVRPESVTRRGKRLAMLLRLELYWPGQDYRSETVSIELDPVRRRMRQTVMQGFSEHHLEGEAAAPVWANRWIHTRGTFTDEEFDRLWELGTEILG
jgi:hypothetical protein